MGTAAAPSSNRQTTDQKRAAWAWRAASQAEDAKKYATLVKSVPTLIMNSGLIQTLAYLNGKDKLCDQLAGQLCTQLGLGATAAVAVPKLIGLDAVRYRDVTGEAMALLRWLRHLAAVAAKAAEQGPGGRTR